MRIIILIQMRFLKRTKLLYQQLMTSLWKSEQSKSWKKKRTEFTRLLLLSVNGFMMCWRDCRWWFVWLPLIITSHILTKLSGRSSASPMAGIATSIAMGNLMGHVSFVSHLKFWKLESLTTGKLPPWMAALSMSMTTPLQMWMVHW